MLNQHDYHQLYHLVFREGYPGYKPTVLEIPNGDGKVDAEKRYAHVAVKYMNGAFGNAILDHYLRLGHELATEVARRIGIPEAFMPDFERSAMRVLEYPPGADSNQHKDFDLFTLMLYRDQPEKFVTPHTITGPDAKLEELQSLAPQAHFGKLAEEIDFALATPHYVLPSESPQHSIAYFAIPKWEAVLPSGLTVMDWLNIERGKRRTEFKKYQ